MKKTVTNTAARDPAITPLQMIGDGSRAIEAQEARGQRELINASVLPTKGTWDSRPTWEAMGIKFGDAVNGDDMFTHVELPAGWSKRATDHSMWSELVDDKGRKRASIFYKAAFYDRSAHITPVRRFTVERDYDRPDCRWAIVFRVKDCGMVVFQTDPVSVAPKDWDAADRAEKAGSKACADWLTDHGYSNFRDAAAYWDVP